MSTLQHGTPPGMLDISQTAPVPVTRLIKVEMRKMVDTRAGLWLLIAIGVITALFTVIFFFAAAGRRAHLRQLHGRDGHAAGLPAAGDGHPAGHPGVGPTHGMVTFTLEPHRGKVMGAKVLAALAFGMLAVLLALVLAALGATGTHRHRWLAGTEQCIAVSEHGRLEIVVRWETKVPLNSRSTMAAWSKVIIIAWRTASSLVGAFWVLSCKIQGAPPVAPESVL